MNKIAVCPKNKKHKEFVTVAHVTEDWVVDEHGHFLSVVRDSDHQIVAPPHPDNIWTCYICGAEAKFIDKGGDTKCQSNN